MGIRVLALLLAGLLALSAAKLDAKNWTIATDAGIENASAIIVKVKDGADFLEKVSDLGVVEAGGK